MSSLRLTIDTYSGCDYQASAERNAQQGSDTEKHQELVGGEQVPVDVPDGVETARDNELHANWSS